MSFGTGKHKLISLPLVMLLPDHPLLKRLPEGQQGKSSRQNKIFLLVSLAVQGIV